MHWYRASPLISLVSVGRPHPDARGLLSRMRSERPAHSHALVIRRHLTHLQPLASTLYAGQAGVAPFLSDVESWKGASHSLV